jgi:hypothetical protein
MWRISSRLFLATVCVFGSGLENILERFSLAFEENRGQFAERYSHGARAAGYTALFGKRGVLYRTAGGDELEMRWEGARPVRLEGVGELPGKVNVYSGRDTRKWVTGARTFGQLVGRELYEGIDVVYYGDGRRVEFDLMVAPGADVSRVAFRVAGARMDGDGNVTAGGLVWRRPVAYQTVDGRRVEVAARFEVAGGGRVGIAVGEYDRQRELVIDPVVEWGIIVGNAASFTPNTRAVGLDGAGNLYVAGSTLDTSFGELTPIRAPAGGEEAFLLKYSPDGKTLLFATFYGGSGREWDVVMAVDGAGNSVVAGRTASADLSLKDAVQTELRSMPDIFVAKFTASGALQYSTYLGGQAEEIARGVAVDATGNAFVTGSTGSSDFPSVGGYQRTLRGGTDVYLVKLLPNGSIGFSTFLGGDSNDTSAGVALGPGGSIYVAGSTKSNNFPTRNALQSTSLTDGTFVTRFDSTGGDLVYSTYLHGTSSGAIVTALAVDASGAAYVAGAAEEGYPVKGGIPMPAPFGSAKMGYVTKVAPAGGTILYSTLLGGRAGTTVLAISADSEGVATVVGATGSDDFPTYAAFRPAHEWGDGFLTRINAPGDSILFSSYVGGQGYDTIEGLVMDGAGAAYVVGLSQSTDFPSPRSSDSPVTFLAKISGPVAVVPVTFTTLPAGLEVKVDNAVVKTPATFFWAPGVNHQLFVPEPQSAPLAAHWFENWSQGGESQQSVTTPASATTYTASFRTIPCSYSLRSYKASFGQLGGFSAVSVGTSLGCKWDLSVDVPWILVPQPQGTGPSETSFSVTRNTSTEARTGTIRMGDAVLTVRQSPLPPTVEYNACCQGEGLVQWIGITVRDPDGNDDLTVTNVLVNNVLDGRAACYLAYDHVGRVLYLVNDRGTEISGMQIGADNRGSGVLANGQCAVDGRQTYLSERPHSMGPSVSLQTKLTYSPAFAGRKVVYVAARDKTGGNSGWVPASVWNVPGPAALPAPVSVTYDSSPSRQVTVNYRSPTDYTAISTAQILINSAIDGRRGCYMGYDRARNLLYLVADDGGTLLDAITPGAGSATQQNSQCILYAEGSSVSASGADLTLRVRVTFLEAFRGQRIVYAGVQTTGGLNSGWRAMGVYSVP